MDKRNSNGRPLPPSAHTQVSGGKNRGFWARIRGYFLAGVLVTARVGITGYLAWVIVGFIDHSITPLLPDKYNPETYLPFSLPGLGVIILILVLTVIGALTAGLLGRWLVHTGERILNRMPVIRSFYSATKLTKLALTHRFLDAMLVMNRLEALVRPRNLVNRSEI